MGEFTYIGTSALINRGENALRAALLESAEHLVGSAQAATPVDTGTLRGSIHAGELEGGGASMRILVQTGGEASAYAIYVHEGTGPHVILPREKEALAFGGVVVRKVNHPGTRAYKYLEGPLIAMRPVYLAALERAAAGVY